MWCHEERLIFILSNAARSRSDGHDVIWSKLTVDTSTFSWKHGSIVSIRFSSDGWNQRRLDGLPDAMCKLGSAGSSSRCKREVVVRSSSDGCSNIKRKVHDRGPITPRSSPIAAAESTSVWSESKCMISGIDPHQMAESMSGGSSTIEARSPHDRGHDQALLWYNRNGNQDHNQERMMATINVWSWPPIGSQSRIKRLPKIWQNFPLKDDVFLFSSSTFDWFVKQLSEFGAKS